MTTHLPPSVLTADLLGLLMDSASAAVAMKDLQHRYVYANRAMENVLRAQPGELTGTTAERWLGKSRADELHSLEQDIVRTGLPSHQLSQEIIAGVNTRCAVTRFPFRDTSGQIIGIGIVGFVADQQEMPSAQAVLDNAQRNINALQAALEAIEKDSPTDRLTGAWSRTRLEEEVRHEIDRALRYGHKASIVFMDVDGLRQINEQHGMARGDAVLKALCDIARSCLRTTDRIGRWDGEEFFLLLPNTPAMSARMVAERVKKAVLRHEFEDIGQITASFGVAACHDRDTLEGWVARAQGALDYAKSRGRGRVESDLVDVRDSDLAEKAAPSLIRLFWRRKYESGNTELDRQHKALFDTTNQVLAALLDHHPDAEIAAMIGALLTDIQAHFRFEEELLEAAGYPLAKHHGERHAELLEHADAMLAKYEDNRLGLMEVFNFLAYESIARHLLVEDSQFYPTLRSRRND